MTTLHCLTKSPFQQPLDCVLERVLPGDTLLFCEDAVYYLLQNVKEPLPEEVKCYFLHDDIVARGLKTNERITTISYHEWVELTLVHTNQIRW